MKSDVHMQWIDTTHDRAGARQIGVNVVSQEGLFADLEHRLAAGDGFCLATLNLDHVVKLRQSKDFCEAYRTHSHVTADGRPIAWLSRLAGQPVELLPGSDLMLPMIAMAQRLQLPIAFFGATEAALQGAAQNLRRSFPDLEIAACIAPPMGFDPQSPQADAFIDALRASGARIVFIALGAPKQEIFAQRAHAAAPHMGFASIGAGVDFIAGTQTRAPRLVRGLAGEWLWRLAGNPRRLFWRYMACFAILPSLTVRALQGRLARNSDVRAR